MSDTVHARRSALTALTPDLDHVRGRYRVRFARSEADLDAVFRMRFEVFNLEMGEGLEESFDTGRDSDRFDAQCEHVMVIDDESDSTIGTYRMQVAESAERANGFYAETEFDLSGLPAEVVAQSIELGRACIAKEHRNRTVLFLLWKGLASYVLWNRKRYFFGCSSLTSQDPLEGLRFHDQLRRMGHAHPDWLVPVLPSYACVVDDYVPSREDAPIPTLFSTYLRYGAKVASEPALDRFFGTIDFLTILDVAAMDERTFRTFTR